MLPITAAQVREALSTAESRLCEDYKKVLLQRTQCTVGEESEAWRLLTNICDLYLPWDVTDDEPFRALVFLARIPDDAFMAAARLAREVDDAELVARCCDVYWVRRSNKKRQREDIDFVNAAIDAYIVAARSLEDADEWLPSVTRLQRALALARRLNMLDKHQLIITEIEAMLGRHGGRDPLFLSLRLMELLFLADAGNPEQCITYCEEAATRAEAEAEAQRDYQVLELRARQYLDMQMKWLERAGSAQISEVWKRIARNYERAATLCAHPGNHAVAGHFQEKAVECLRRARADRAVTTAAHRRLLELQKLAPRS